MVVRQNNSHQWHLFGKWVEPVLAISFWTQMGRTKVFKDLKFNFISQAKDLNYSYFFLKKDLDKLSNFIERKIVKDKAWFTKLFSLCDRAAQNLLALKGKKDIDKVFSAGAEVLNATYLIEFTDYGLHNYLEKISEKDGISMADILARMKPYKKTLLMKFQEELKTLKNKKEISDFVKKYEWVGTHMFMGDGLTEKKVKKEMADLLKKGAGKLTFKKLLRHYDEAIKIGSKMAYYRTYLVEIFTIISYQYWPIIKDIAKRNGLTWEDILLFTYDEIINLNNKKIKPKNYQERKKGVGVINIKNKIHIVTGTKLKKEIKECQEKIKTDNIKELKGISACLGKAKGVVKIVEQAKDISKMNKGDILVAPETTPDYVIGMRVAGAIVTNQGGITSHAAIVSREMGIPCIIGTKIATKVLKDGDLVEVDADKGIVKILKTKK